MCNMRWTVRVVYFCIFIALISITAGAADIKKFEAPETKSIYCVDPVIILDITQYGKGFKGIKFSQKDVGIDQTLDILRKWSNPADLDEFNSTLLKKKSLSPQAQAKYIKRKKEYAKNRDFRIYSECRFIHKDEEYRCINYFVTKVIAGKDMIDNSGFVNLKKVEDQWKIASLDHVLFPFQVVFHLMPSDVFAYMVFGTEDILDQAKVKQIDKDKLINLRSRMLNSEGELNMVDFAAYIRKVQDGYQDEEMASLLINQPPKI